MLIIQIAISFSSNKKLGQEYNSYSHIAAFHFTQSLTKVNFYNSMNCHDFIVMWSSVVLFVLTFAVLGLLLGFAAVYDTNQEGPMGEALIHENVTANATQGNQSGSPNTNEESE